jgi:hypothetical protein
VFNPRPRPPPRPELDLSQRKCSSPLTVLSLSLSRVIRRSSPKSLPLQTLIHLITKTFPYLSSLSCSSSPPSSSPSGNDTKYDDRPNPIPIHACRPRDRTASLVDRNSLDELERFQLEEMQAYQRNLGFGSVRSSSSFPPSLSLSWPMREDGAQGRPTKLTDRFFAWHTVAYETVHLRRYGASETRWGRGLRAEWSEQRRKFLLASFPSLPFPGRHVLAPPPHSPPCNRAG